MSEFAGLGAGEFVFTGEDFRQIAAMLHADAGIHLPESKATLVYSRLAKRLRALGLQSFRDYCALVASADGADERQQMLAALTTNVTRFFREPHHFDHLRKQVVLPPLLDAARRGGRVRLWSAACSSGQEPYSIALTVLSPDARRGAVIDVRILATDIDPQHGRRGERGRLRRRAALTAGARRAAPALVHSDAAATDGEMRASVDDALRELVAFRELN